jgi:N-dimethylarginine dimethylaminohydrolase
MRRRHPITRAAAGVAAGVITSAVFVIVVGAAVDHSTPRYKLVPEDASGHLHRIAIHYTPTMDERAMPVWRQLFAKLPADVEVEVAVDRKADFDQLVSNLAGTDAHTERMHPVVVDRPLTTWSRDRMAALDGESGPAVLAPPRVSVASGGRAGDWEAPFAIARDVYHEKPIISEMVFEGGDMAASSSHVFADANLIGRNLGRRDATREHLERVLEHTFTQDVIFLGDAQGEVPEHHIMMYMVPLDDHRVLVGDVAMGQKLTPPELDTDADIELHRRRFDRVAEILAARGFEVTRIPVVVLPGAGSYVTYTNALFDRDASGPIVYLPTYDQPALDDAATSAYQKLGYRVIPIDVSSIYTLNGSLGCLVNVMARS